MKTTSSLSRLHGLLLVSVLFGFSAGFPKFKDVRSERATTDTGLAGYIQRALESYRDVMKHGVPEFGIAPLEPVKLDNISFDGDARGVRVQSNFTNMTLLGLSTMQIPLLQASLSQKTLKLELNFKNWTVEGWYCMKGKVIGIIPLYGNGTFVMEATGVVIKGQAPLTLNSNGSVTVQPLQLEVTPNDVNIHFHNLYGGGAWGSFVSKTANFFANTIFEKAKPKITRNIQTFLTNSLNRKLKDIDVAKL